MSNLPGVHPSCVDGGFLAFRVALIYQLNSSGARCVMSFKYIGTSRLRQEYGPPHCSIPRLSVHESTHSHTYKKKYILLAADTGWITCCPDPTPVVSNLYKLYGVYCMIDNNDMRVYDVPILPIQRRIFSYDLLLAIRVSCSLT